MTRIITLFVFMISCLLSYGEDVVALADTAYNKKDYTTALSYYRTAMETNGISSNLYYNIGNTYYRMGDLGHAIVNYRRALQLDPSNADARTNLEFVKAKIVDRPEDDSTFLSNLHNKVVAMMSPNAWAWTAFTIFLILLAALALYMFSGNVNLRKAGFFGGFIVLILFIYTGIVAWNAADALDDHSAAVVIVPTTNLRSVPASSNSKNDKVVPIHEGTEVQIIDSLATPTDPVSPMWYDVKINNTSRAWVSASDVERI